MATSLRYTDAENTKLVKATREQGKLTLSELLPGPENAALRESVVAGNSIKPKGAKREMVIKTRQIGSSKEHEVLAVAAVVVRDPGLTQDYIDAIQDYLPTSGRSKEQQVRQFWTIYQNEGIINNAINKIAAILSAGGHATVRNAKAGKQRKAKETLQAILDDFVLNVNNSPLDGVVTGSRGLKSLTQQAVRQALVEGDWFGRTIWSQHQVGTYGSFDMPMTIQSVTSAQIEPAKEFQGTGAELFYWKPPASLIQQIQKPTNKDIADQVKKFVQDKDILNQLKKNKKAFLDPALLMHLKHRGIDANPFGESFIQPTLNGLAFKRSVEALDFVSMESLINRLTIVQVGAGGKDSKYSDPSLSATRASIMQAFFDDPGPNMTIIWQGDDVKIQDVGAHSQLVNTDDRHKIALSKVKDGMGVPDALLSGSTGDGKAAGWAATIGAAAELEELQNGFATSYTTICERIAVENGFQDVDVIFQFDNSLMADKAEEWNQARQDYVAGAFSIRTYLELRGRDAEAEYNQMCTEKGLTAGTALWKDAFAPPQGLPGQGKDGAPPGQGGGNTSPQGKPPGTPNPPDTPKEKKTPVENK
jgi:hypothetical protein